MLPQSGLAAAIEVTDLNNALVLVTGATGGFGRHFVRQLLDIGSRLVISDIDNAALERLLDELGENRQRVAAAVACDLAEPSGPSVLHADLQARGLSPDVIINNAGVGVAGRIDLVPADRWEALMQINLLAPMRLTTLLLPVCAG